MVSTDFNALMNAQNVPHIIKKTSPLHLVRRLEVKQFTNLSFFDGSTHNQLGTRLVSPFRRFKLDYRIYHF